MPKKGSGTSPMTPSASARIQSTQAKAGNDTGKGSFPARAQASAAKNTNAGAGVAVGGATPKAAAASSGTAKPPSGGKTSKK